MPSPVHVTKAADLKMSSGQTDGIIRKVWPPSTKTSSQYTPSRYRYLLTPLSSLTGRNNIPPPIHLCLPHDGPPQIRLRRPPPQVPGHNRLRCLRPWNNNLGGWEEEVGSCSRRFSALCRRTRSVRR